MKFTTAHGLYTMINYEGYFCHHKKEGAQPPLVYYIEYFS